MNHIIPMHALRLPNPLAPAPWRLPNPSTGTWIALGVGAAVIISGIVFFTTREAAAAAKATEAFTVSADCMTITVTDEDKAKGAAAAAVLAVHPSIMTPAIVAVREVFAVLLPECDWVNVPPDRLFVQGSSRWTWAQLEANLAGRTVGELRDFVGSQPAFVALPYPRMIDWIIRPTPLPPPPLPPAASGMFAPRY